MSVYLPNTTLKCVADVVGQGHVFYTTQVRSNGGRVISSDINADDDADSDGDREGSEEPPSSTSRAGRPERSRREELEFANLLALDAREREMEEFGDELPLPGTRGALERVNARMHARAREIEMEQRWADFEAWQRQRRRLREAAAASSGDVTIARDDHSANSINESDRPRTSGTSGGNTNLPTTSSSGINHVSLNPAADRPMRAFHTHSHTPDDSASATDDAGHAAAVAGLSGPLRRLRAATDASDREENENVDGYCHNHGNAPAVFATGHVAEGPSLMPLHSGSSLDSEEPNIHPSDTASASTHSLWSAMRMRTLNNNARSTVGASGPVSISEVGFSDGRDRGVHSIRLLMPWEREAAERAESERRRAEAEVLEREARLERERREQETRERERVAREEQEKLERQLRAEREAAERREREAREELARRERERLRAEEEERLRREEAERLRREEEARLRREEEGRLLREEQERLRVIREAVERLTRARRLAEVRAEREKEEALLREKLLREAGERERAFVRGVWRGRDRANPTAGNALTEEDVKPTDNTLRLVAEGRALPLVSYLNYNRRDAQQASAKAHAEKLRRLAREREEQDERRRADLAAREADLERQRARREADRRRDEERLAALREKQQELEDLLTRERGAARARLETEYSGVLAAVRATRAENIVRERLRAGREREAVEALLRLRSRVDGGEDADDSDEMSGASGESASAPVIPAIHIVEDHIVAVMPRPEPTDPDSVAAEASADTRSPRRAGYPRRRGAAAVAVAASRAAGHVTAFPADNSGVEGDDTSEENAASLNEAGGDNAPVESQPEVDADTADTDSAANDAESRDNGEVDDERSNAPTETAPNASHPTPARSSADRTLMNIIRGRRGGDASRAASNSGTAATAPIATHAGESSAVDATLDAMPSSDSAVTPSPEAAASDAAESAPAVVSAPAGGTLVDMVRRRRSGLVTGGETPSTDNRSEPLPTPAATVSLEEPRTDPPSEPALAAGSDLTSGSVAAAHAEDEPVDVDVDEENDREDQANSADKEAADDFEEELDLHTGGEASDRFPTEVEEEIVDTTHTVAQPEAPRGYEVDLDFDMESEPDVPVLPVRDITTETRSSPQPPIASITSPVNVPATPPTNAPISAWSPPAVPAHTTHPLRPSTPQPAPPAPAPPTSSPRPIEPHTTPPRTTSDASVPIPTPTRPAPSVGPPAWTSHGNSVSITLPIHTPSPSPTPQPNTQPTALPAAQPIPAPPAQPMQPSPMQPLQPLQPSHSPAITPLPTPITSDTATPLYNHESAYGALSPQPLLTPAARDAAAPVHTGHPYIYDDSPFVPVPHVQPSTNAHANALISNAMPVGGTASHASTFVPPMTVEVLPLEGEMLHAGHLPYGRNALHASNAPRATSAPWTGHSSPPRRIDDGFNAPSVSNRMPSAAGGGGNSFGGGNTHFGAGGSVVGNIGGGSVGSGGWGSIYEDDTGVWPDNGAHTIIDLSTLLNSGNSVSGGSFTPADTNSNTNSANPPTNDSVASNLLVGSNSRVAESSVETVLRAPQPADLTLEVNRRLAEREPISLRTEAHLDEFAEDEDNLEELDKPRNSGGSIPVREENEGRRDNARLAPVASDGLASRSRDSDRFRSSWDEEGEDIFVDTRRRSNSPGSMFEDSALTSPAHSSSVRDEWSETTRWDNDRSSARGERESSRRLQERAEFAEWARERERQRLLDVLLRERELARELSPRERRALELERQRRGEMEWRIERERQLLWEREKIREAARRGRRSRRDDHFDEYDIDGYSDERGDSRAGWRDGDMDMRLALEREREAEMLRARLREIDRERAFARERERERARERPSRRRGREETLEVMTPTMHVVETSEIVEEINNSDGADINVRVPSGVERGAGRGDDNNAETPNDKEDGQEDSAEIPSDKKVGDAGAAIPSDSDDKDDDVEVESNNREFRPHHDPRKVKPTVGTDSMVLVRYPNGVWGYIDYSRRGEAMRDRLFRIMSELNGHARNSTLPTGGYRRYTSSHNPVPMEGRPLPHAGLTRLAALSEDEDAEEEEDVPLTRSARRRQERSEDSRAGLGVSVAATGHRSGDVDSVRGTESDLADTRQDEDTIYSFDPAPNAAVSAANGTRESTPAASLVDLIARRRGVRTTAISIDAKKTALPREEDALSSPLIEPRLDLAREKDPFHDPHQREHLRWLLERMIGRREETEEERSPAAYRVPEKWLYARDRSSFLNYLYVASERARESLPLDHLSVILK